MADVKEQLINMFIKMNAGNVTMEEGAMLINSLAKKDGQEVVKVFMGLIHKTPQGLMPQRVFTTLAMTKNRLFFDVLTSTLEHKNEEVSLYACEEIAKYFKNEIKYVLVDHLNSDVYNVRKVTASTITKIYGDDGIQMLKNHIVTRDEHYHRLTSAEAVIKVGRKGIDVMVELLNSDVPGAVMTSAEALTVVVPQLTDDDLNKTVYALLQAGDTKNIQGIVSLLKMIAAFGSKASKFDGYVQAYVDYPDDAVTNEAQVTLKAIKSGGKSMEVSRF